MLDLFKSSSAVLSECGLYRYRLERRWADGPKALFIMLNPSTADAEKDDPTIRRCISFAKREGCGGLIVVNLFAFRATEPDALLLADDPIGPDNPGALAAAVADCDGPLIAAWGAWPGARAAGEAVVRKLGPRARCLGLTKAGSPRHPLYVAGDAPLIALP